MLLDLLLSIFICVVFTKVNESSYIRKLQIIIKNITLFGAKNFVLPLSIINGVRTVFEEKGVR